MHCITILVLFGSVLVGLVFDGSVMVGLFVCFVLFCFVWLVLVGLVWFWLVFIGLVLVGLVFIDIILEGLGGTYRLSKLRQQVRSCYRHTSRLIYFKRLPRVLNLLGTSNFLKTQGLLLKQYLLICKV